jgi:NADP-dependent 3-hydroxy acid dehydrogenase YdfG
VPYPTEVDPLDALQEEEMRGLTDRPQGTNSLFHRVCWRQSPWLPGNRLDLKKSRVLLFKDDHGLGDRLLDALTEAGASCITVATGDGYTNDAIDRYRIAPGCAEDYQRLFMDLKARQQNPSMIIHAWCYGAAGRIEPGEPERTGYERMVGYQSLLEIVRNYSTVFGPSPACIRAIGSGWYKVLGEEPLCPARSIALAAIKCIPQEFQYLDCRAIDVVDSPRLPMETLLTELTYNDAAPEIAIRGHRRFVKDFERIEFSMPAETAVFTKGATYLITGAGGGLGRLFAGFLSEHYGANLILLGRTEPDQAWLDHLREKGSRVIAIRSDIADAVETTSRLIAAEQQLGPVSGIIHAAGLPDNAGVILRRSGEEDDLVFAPKIGGMNTLWQLFGQRSLDFFVTCSSGAASMVPFGQLAYAAANTYLDAFAEMGAAPYPVISIQWPPIREIGMAARSAGQLSADEQTRYFRHGLDPAEVLQVLAAAIYLRLPVPVISPRDFGKVYRNSKKAVRVEAIQPSEQQSRERPSLAGRYVVPETDTERKLTGIMERLLGIGRIGVEDDFFELGGDSLKGMLLLKHISKELTVELTLNDLFGNHTIRQMATLVDELHSLSVKRERTSKITI